MHTRPLGSQDERENIETMMNDAVSNEAVHLSGWAWVGGKLVTAPHFI